MYYSYCPTKRIDGEQSIRSLLRELSTADRIAVVASGTSAAGTAVLAELESVASRIVLQKVYTSAGEPGYAAAAALADDFAAHRISHIICIGGASIIDLAKAAAVMAQYEGDAEAKWTKLAASPFDTAAIPLAVVSTVPGASSESNSTFVIVDPKGYKRPMARINCFPLVMAFDPAFSAGITAAQLHKGMFDAFTHVLEQCIRPERVCLTNDGVCISAISTLFDLSHRLLDGNFAQADLLRYARISSIILDSSTLGRGVEVDSVTHEIAIFLSAHFAMAHGSTLAAVLPEYLDHPASIAKRQRFEHLTRQSVAAVNAFYGRDVLPSFDVRRHIAEIGIVDARPARCSDGSLEPAIRQFIDERETFWAQKRVETRDVEAILRTVLARLHA